MAGRFGVACFYSFASTKYWPAGGGGLAMVHCARPGAQTGRYDSIAVAALARAGIARPAAAGGQGVVFHRRLYGLFGRPMRRWAEQWALLEPCLDLEAIPALLRRGRLPPGAAVSRPGWSVQRANSLRLLAQLGEVENVVLPRERPGAQYNYHLFPVLLRNRARAHRGDGRDVGEVRRHVHDLQRRGAGVPAPGISGRLSGGRVGGRTPDHAAELRGPHAITISIDVAEVFLSTLQICRDAQPSEARLRRELTGQTL